MRKRKKERKEKEKNDKVGNNPKSPNGAILVTKKIKQKLTQKKEEQVVKRLNNVSYDLACLK